MRSHGAYNYRLLIVGNSAFSVKQYFSVRIFWWLHPVAINVKTNKPQFGILANYKIKMCHNSMKKIMIQNITQNNWNFWTVNRIMRGKKLLSSRQIFRYAVPARTITKKALVGNIQWKGRSPFSHLSHPNPNSYPNITLTLNLTQTLILTLTNPDSRMVAVCDCFAVQPHHHWSLSSSSGNF